MRTRLPGPAALCAVLGAWFLAGAAPAAGAVTFDIGPASGTITLANPVITVPVTLSGFVPPAPAGNGAKGFQVTVALSPGLSVRKAPLDRGVPESVAESGVVRTLSV